jgi:tetratricopeptide (TPR) repeat protein
MRPGYPAEINFSYYEASLVCEMIETEKGIGAIRAMLAAWGQGLDTPAVVERVLGLKADAFNQHFDSWLRTRFATPLASVDSSDGVKPVTGKYEKTMAHALELRDAGANDSARVVLDSAARLFPGYGGDDGAAWYLARLDSTSGDWRAAVAQLAVITSTEETADKPNDLEAAFRLKLGDSTGALAALQRLQWITPYDPALHVRTAELADAMGKWDVALTERRAVLALAPVDRLEARYQVARALQRAGDVAGARREVLAVLEAAPGFEKAQALLLQLQGNH